MILVHLTIPDNAPTILDTLRGLLIGGVADSFLWFYIIRPPNLTAILLYHRSSAERTRAMFRASIGKLSWATGWIQ